VVHRFLESTMQSSFIRSVAVVLAAGACATAFAQSVPTPSVMVDTAPPPASERNSIGAVIMEDSMVIAQREHYQRVAVARDYRSIGRDATRITLDEQRKADLAAARAAEAARAMGNR
jgi:hypothetical protein